MEEQSTFEGIVVIGAGLAGCEAAWQIAERGIPVRLIEMKPQKRTPAHHADGYAELVCSNSLRAADVTNAVGLLKEELRRAGSLIMKAADVCAVPAGGALAVDRVQFSAYVTEKIKAHPLIEIEEREVTALPKSGLTVVASGPLTADTLAADILKTAEALRGGGGTLHFFDAAAPIVDASTVDLSVAYFSSRYGKGDPTDYLNCPMTKEEYDAFYEALIKAETAELKEFDQEQQKDLKVFEGCMPVEVMAARGYDTLCYGPMKPVGLPHPETGKEYYAVVQLRRENKEGSMYNLVGFQTHLTFEAQRRVFRMIPGLSQAVFLRYGVMHRNTYLHSPGLLSPTYRMKGLPHLFFAGQMTGVEGYVESVSSGLVAGIAAACAYCETEPFVFPRETVIGALAHYVAEGLTDDFQPMNANFGIVAPIEHKVKGGKRGRKQAYAERSLALMDEHKTAIFQSGRR